MIVRTCVSTMCPPIPTELWEQIFRLFTFHERPTLYALLFVSHRFHDIARPILAKIHIVTVCASRAKGKQEIFQRCVIAFRDRLTSDLRYFVFRIRRNHAQRMARDWPYLFLIIRSLESTLESIIIHERPKPYTVLVDHLRTLRSLKHFGWLCDADPPHPLMEETLLQHDQIERLVLHPNYNHLSLSPNDLPHLRYLSGSLKNIIRTLSGHRLTHLQTSFFDGGENLIRRGCLDNYTVKSLSCYSQDLQALGAFAEHLKNLECLELHRAGCVGDWWKGYQLRNNPLRFIRFAREMSGRGYGPPKSPQGSRSINVLVAVVSR
ncbi:hypothetical protein AB1N83_004029 [Pleurotus pulmonarius]